MCMFVTNLMGKPIIAFFMWYLVLYCCASYDIVIGMTGCFGTDSFAIQATTPNKCR